MSSTTDRNALLEAMRAASISSSSTKTSLPMKKPKSEDEEASQRIAELEKLFLTPPQQFDDEWLNKLQE